MSKNVAVFVDVANIFYAAKAAGVDIDYVTLLKASSAGRDLVRAYAYTGLDPDNENQRNFHDFLRRHGYKVVSKDIRKYGDGKVKANLDIELVVDMMKTARNLDIAIVVSGDGDFAPAIRAVQEMGVRVEVVSFRGNTSSDLIDVADIFTDITQIAKVEKGSARSGRRVADDDEDLSMTEVPDKMTEGSGDGRRRGRGSRSRTGEPATTRTPTSRATTSRARTSTSRAAAARDAIVADGALVALPGEKLSRAGRAAAAASEVEDEVQPDLEPDEALAVDGEMAVDGEVGAEAVGGEGDAPHRRRRRRGGRGRGRGRGRELEAPAEGVAPAGEAEDFEEPEPLPAPRRQAFSFGSVWDSQLGKAPAAASGGPALGPIEEDEDLEEPAIPEYLLAERRNREGARRGGRGGGPGRRGGAYAAALERERFGGGRGTTTSRFAEPQQRHRDAGAGRAPVRGPMGRGYERSEPRPSSSEPWSEVPPEIEAMLRAQMAGSGRSTRPRPEAGEGATGATAVPGREGPAEKPAARPRAAAKPRASRTSGTKAEGTPAEAGSPVEAAAKTATRARRTTKASADAVGSPVTAGSPEADPAAAPKRTRRPKAAAEKGDATGQPSVEPAAAPKRRTTRRTPAATD